MRYIIIFILFSLSVTVKAYDSTIMACNQKYLIREAVANNEDVGVWYKAFSHVEWSHNIDYQIKTSQSRFKITEYDSDSALIEVNNTALINGKIVAHDTTVKLAIYTIDRGALSLSPIDDLYEVDTAYIRIVEAANCIFDTFTGFAPGKAMFFERGTSIPGVEHSWTNTNGTAANPILIGAYGNGERPICDGAALPSGEIFLNFSNDSYVPTYIYVYDMAVINFPDVAVNFEHNGHHNGVYNCYFVNNTRNGAFEDLADIFFQGTDDIYVYIERYIEVINIISINTGECIVKTDQSGLNMYNIYGDGDDSNDGLIRFAGGGFGSLNYSYIKDGSKAVQIEYPHITIYYCTIVSSGSGDVGGLSFETDGVNTPDSCSVINCRLVSNNYGINFYNDAMADSTYIADNFFDGNTKGMWYRNIQDKQYIWRNIFQGNGTNAIDVDNSGTGAEYHIDYNIFYTSGPIDIDKGTDIDLHNNTVDGTIDLTGVSTGYQNGNYFKVFTNPRTASNNIDIDTITTANHFIDYAGHDYHLKSTAISAINGAIYWGQNSDIRGATKYLYQWDVGAYEYNPKVPPAGTINTKKGGKLIVTRKGNKFIYSSKD